MGLKVETLQLQFIKFRQLRVTRVDMRTHFMKSGLFLAGLFLPWFGMGQKAESMVRIKATPDFELTGDGSAKEWKTTDWIPVPHRQGQKTYETKVKLLYSETGIYGIFFCEDEVITSTLRADFTDLYNEDVVEIFFWTDESKPLYFEYELSPHNFELPILVPNSKGTFLGWLPWHYEGDRKTRHATRIDNQHWTAEFFIPYALLKPLENVPPKKGMKWRCNFYRIDYDAGTSSWSWQKTRINFHDYEKFGTIVFD